MSNIRREVLIVVSGMLFFDRKIDLCQPKTRSCLY